MAHLSYADEFPRGRAPAPSGSPLLAAALACVASFTVVYSYLAAQPRAVDLWTAAPVRVAPHVRTAPMAPPPHVTGGQASAHVHREAQAPPAPVPGPWAARYEALNAKTVCLRWGLGGGVCEGPCLGHRPPRPPPPPGPVVLWSRRWMHPQMHQTRRDLRGGPSGGQAGGWRRLPKRLGAVAVIYKCL